MREHLDEGVLDGFVGFSRIPEILICDADRAPLVTSDELAETLAALVQRAALDEAADFDRESRVLVERNRRRAAAPAHGRGRCAVAGGSVRRRSDNRAMICTHTGITIRSDQC